jgi:hypothetical protein
MKCLPQLKKKMRIQLFQAPLLLWLAVVAVVVAAVLVLVLALVPKVVAVVAGNLCKVVRRGNLRDAVNQPLEKVEPKA